MHYGRNSETYLFVYDNIQIEIDLVITYLFSIN